MRMATIPAAAVSAVLLLAPPLHAQAVAIGARAGLSISTFGGSDAGSPGNLAGFVGGGYATFRLLGPIAFQPELLYVTRGAKDVSATTDLKLTYLELPLLARIDVPVGGTSALAPYLVGGGYFALKAGCEVTIEEQGRIVTTGCDDPFLQEQPSLKTPDVGVTFGAGTDVRIGNTTLTVDARYDLGLSKIDDASPPADVRNRVLLLTIGVRLYPLPEER